VWGEAGVITVRKDTKASNEGATIMLIRYGEHIMCLFLSNSGNCKSPRIKIFAWIFLARVAICFIALIFLVTKLGDRVDLFIMETIEPESNSTSKSHLQQYKL
jgi:hypothetical protein